MSDLARRTFLGFLGGLAAAPVVRAFIPPTVTITPAPIIPFEPDILYWDLELQRDYIRHVFYDDVMGQMRSEMIAAKEFYVGSQWEV